MGSKLFRDPQALSTALAALGVTIQPKAFGYLNNLFQCRTIIYGIEL